MNKTENKRFSILFLVAFILFTSLGFYCNLYKEQITISISGKNTKVSTFKKTVKELLNEQKIKYDSDDKIIPGLNQETKDDMDIKVVRVDIKNTKEYEVVPFETKIIEDKDLLKGVTKVIQDGNYGKRELSYNLVFEDDKLINKELIYKNIFVNPVAKIIKKGTKEVLSLTSRGDFSRINEYKHMNVVATAYAGDTITSTGTRPKWGTIAVDPRVIPYGSKVYIPRFDMIFKAEDCGGAIKGNKIDIFMNSESQCNTWGRRSIDIYIIK